MARLGLKTVKQLKNGAVILSYGHGTAETALRTVTAGGELSLDQVARLVGTYHLRVWRAVKAKKLASRKTARGYRVGVKEAGRWERTLKAGS
jgi:hypothetical protein